MLQRRGGGWPWDPENPWADHWSVYVWYCSSDEWAGTRGPGPETGGLYFHGRHILEAVVADLSANHRLQVRSHRACAPRPGSRWTYRARG